MIAAPSRRAAAPGKAAATAARRLTWRVDRLANRGLERAYVSLHALVIWLLERDRRLTAILGPPARRGAAILFRLLAVGERAVRRFAAVAARAATAASRVLTPARAIGLAIVAAGLALAVAQFVDYRGVEIGQPAYAGLPDVAKPPTVAIRSAGEAHAYLLLPLGLLAALAGAFTLVRERRRLGLAVAALGLVSLAVILLVDLPSGLDAGAQTSRFSGASAVLKDGFYAELAAAAGLVLSGLLYYARPCRIRISSSGRAASARRRRPRRRDSSQARVARSA